MVLEGASIDASPFSSDGHPESDSDTFSTADEQGSLGTWALDTSKLKMPIPVLGFITGMTPSIVREQIPRLGKPIDQQVFKFTGRHLKQDEWQALAEHYSTALQFESVTRAAGVGLAARYCWKGWSTYRLPLYQPNMEAFRQNSKFGPFKGQMAKAILHSIRITSYYGLGWGCGLAIGRWTGNIQALSLCFTDPRLKQLVEEYKAGLQQQQQKGRRQQSGTRRGEPFTQGESRRDVDGALDTRDGLRPSRDQTERSAGVTTSTLSSQGKVEDDMSPTGGSFYDTYAGNGNVPNSSLSQNSYFERQSGRGFDSESNVTNSEVISGKSNSTRSGSETELQNSAESSWDRIRRNSFSPASNDAISDSNDETRRAADQSRTEGDPFAFSEDGRRSNQRAAQEEFDARIERERRGQDFNESPGAKRW